jgi:two-component system, OmpR family, KDP operon response regulator KdpE
VQRTILVVDDDSEIRDLAGLILEGGGYSVRKAGSGREALETVASGAPDLVLLDVNMPDMDGWEVLRLLKAHERLRELPVVMFTVKVEFRDKVHALQDGANDYITKPFGSDELLGRVERIFQSLEVRP